MLEKRSDKQKCWLKLRHDVNKISAQWLQWRMTKENWLKWNVLRSNLKIIFKLCSRLTNILSISFYQDFISILSWFIQIRTKQIWKTNSDNISSQKLLKLKEYLRNLNCPRNNLISNYVNSSKLLDHESISSVKNFKTITKLDK